MQSVLKSIHELTSTMAFGATLKNHKNPILIGISSKISTKHKYMYMYQKKYKNGEFSPSHFCQNLARDPVLYSTGTLARFLSNFKNS